MKVAILPVTCDGTPRGTTLTKSWIDKVAARVSQYFDDQSGGRASVEFLVLDWTPLTLTTAQWIAGGTTVGDLVRPEVSAFHGVALAGYDRYAIVVDQPQSGSAATFGSDILMGANTFDPALLAHELGHAFGASHTYLDSPDGPIEYGGPFCIMGADGQKYSFVDASLVSPADGADAFHARSGPGMCVPSLLATGWLNLSQHAIPVVGFADGLMGTTVRIRALDGVPPPGSSGMPVCCYVDSGDRFLVEYRVPQSRWDAGLPPSEAGWVVVNRTPLNGPPASLQIAAFAVSNGATVGLQKMEKYYIYGAGPLRVAVVAHDAGHRTVDLRFLCPKGHAPWYERSDDCFFWTPDVGWRKVPSYSQIREVLEQLARLEELRELSVLAGPQYKENLGQAGEHALSSLRDVVAKLRFGGTNMPNKSLFDEVVRVQQMQSLEGPDLEQHLALLLSIARSIR